MEEYYIGIDIGTGSTKAVAVDRTGRPFGVSQVSYRTVCPRPGYSEQDPAVIWEAFVQCLRALLAETPGKPCCIAVSSAMHSLVAVDDQGDPLIKAITWADSRASDIAEALKASTVGEALYNATGTPVHAISLLAKIIWMAENQPEVFSKAYKFISIKEFIWFKLFAEYQIDHSIASATGLFNITSLTWEPVALELARIDSSKLSAPVPTDLFRSDLSPGARAMLGLEGELKFMIGASDGCLANLGSFALAPKRAAITIGTSGAVRVSSPEPIRNYQAMTFNYLLDRETFICGGPINNGGLSVDWLIKNFLGKGTVTVSEYAALFENIRAVPAGCEGLVFLPYLHGERAPIWDSGAKGTFFGVGSGHQQAHFCRSVLEGVCFALKQVLEILEARHQVIEQIQVGGGFTGSDLWMQMLADITEKPVAVIHMNDASAVGAAYMAMKALHVIPNYDALGEPEGRKFFPRKGVFEVYRKNYYIFKQLYPSLKALMHL